MGEQLKYLLDESRIPKRWYNIQADLPKALPPVLHPGTMKPVGPDDLAPLFPMELIMQEVTTEREVEIPEPVRDIFRLWRPTPLYRARALEMEVGCFTRRPPVSTGIVVFEDLMNLARWADVLVVAARSDPSTHHAVDANVIDALGPQGCLVNVARGDLVDEAALCAALRDGRLAGYAGDVFEREPEVPSEMLAFANAILTPHIGGATDSAQTVMCEVLIANIQRFLATGQPVHSVPPP